MIKRPNAILVNIKDNNGKRWNVIYIRGEDGKYTHVGHEYIKTTDLTNLDPFENWLDYIPDKEWVHPVCARSDGTGGWYLKAFDTFNECRYNNESISLKKLNEMRIIFKCFDKMLDKYKNMTDDELSKELDIGKIETLTKI